ncbi:flagellum-specific ATP synthase [Desulfitispora alkaliphila]|uniref:flagellar protein export ATPase FliI n=1 Tax=Desulfitispora alkaliphila TaxID=622674 RepID=UPI003D1EEEBE
MTRVNKYLKKLDQMQLVTKKGRVEQVVGALIKARGPAVPLGSLCKISSQVNDETLVEVVGFEGDYTLLMALAELGHIQQGSTVELVADGLTVKVGPQLLGKVVNGLGIPLLNGHGLERFTEYSVNNKAPDPLERPRIKTALPVGIKAIDGLLTVGRGQRLGILAGSGVGKSTLLGMMAKNTEADVNVIALIGERGREVNEFIEKELGPEGLKKSVVVVATSEQPPLVRLKGALVATTIAEYFRDQGKDVLLMMDSLTRFAMAQREIGLSTGEPPATRGYTPSVFALLPKLLERAGTAKKGSITGLYTVLVEGDDFNEPITDAVRGILDGHIVMSRKLASQNHFPAIDVMSSVSRVMVDIADLDHQDAANELKKVLATYYDAKDLLDIGAYKKGSSSEIDRAVANIDKCNQFMKQGLTESYGFDETLSQLKKILK